MHIAHLSCKGDDHYFKKTKHETWELGPARRPTALHMINSLLFTSKEQVKNEPLQTWHLYTVFGDCDRSRVGGPVQRHCSS